MPGISKVGSVKYGNFEFPPAFISNVKIIPIYDQSRRTVKYRHFEITIDSVLDPTSLGADPGVTTTDDRMSLLRTKLTTPGEDFTFKEQGLGKDLVIKRNMVIGYGPIPEELLWEPIGSSQCCRVVWRVSFDVADCITQIKAIGSYGEFNYAVNFNIDESGMTVRTITGVMEAIVHRASNNFRRIDISADQFREKIVFPVMEGFKRTQSYNLSNDRRFLNFTIVDTEIPSDNPYYPGMVKCDIRHTLSQPGITCSNMFFLTIAGSIEVAPGWAKWWAWACFHFIVRSRILVMTGLLQDQKGKPLKGADPNVLKNLFFYGLRIEEEIFSRTVHFSISYRTTMPLSEVISLSGLFTAITHPDNPNLKLTWKDWKKWMELAPYSQRGFSRLNHLPQDDLIVDTCSNVDVSLNEGTPNERPNGNPTAFPIFSNSEKPKKHESGILHYRTGTGIYYEKGGICPNETSKEVKKDPNVKVDPGGERMDEVGGVGRGKDAVALTHHVLRKRRGILTMYGEASSLGYALDTKDIPYPKKIQGLDPIPAEAFEFDSVYTGMNMGSLPVYKSRWSRSYVLPFEVIGNNVVEITMGSPADRIKDEQYEA